MTRMVARHPMAEVLRGFPIKVSMSQKTAELDDSVTPDEVVAAVVEAGNYRTVEVTAGELRRTLRGLTSLWLRCPLATANRVCASSGGGDGIARGRKIVIGWSAVVPSRRADSDSWSQVTCVGIAR
jgi:hypothetical protein